MESGSVSRPRTPPRAPSGTKRRRQSAAPPSRYPYVGTGPRRREDELVEIRLERVPGGLRVGEWVGGNLCQRAPCLEADDVAALVTAACDQGVIEGAAAERLVESVRRPTGEAAQASSEPFAKSRGRAGDMHEELRVERLAEGDATVRIARWMLAPANGWQMRDAPTLFAAERYAEAFAAAVSMGLVSAADASQRR